MKKLFPFLAILVTVGFAVLFLGEVIDEVVEKPSNKKAEEDDSPSETD